MNRFKQEEFTAHAKDWSFGQGKSKIKVSKKKKQEETLIAKGTF